MYSSISDGPPASSAARLRRLGDGGVFSGRSGGDGVPSGNAPVPPESIAGVRRSVVGHQRLLRGLWLGRCRLRHRPMISRVLFLALLLLASPALAPVFPLA